MILSFTLMGAAILGLALTPTFAQIGIAAPILLVIFRLTQGFALGGEVGPTTAFLVEAAPLHRRGLYVAIQYMTQDMAVLVAGLVGFILSTRLTAQALDAWGWRVAFLLGTAVVPLGLYMRRSLPETMHESDRLAATAAHGRRIPVRLVVIALMLMMAVSTYLFGLDYITTWVQDSLHLNVGMAFAATVVVGMCAVLADPVSGYLSDRVGRRPVTLGAALALVLLVVPCFMLMSHTRSALAVFVSIAILAVLQAFFTVPALVSVTESLPKAVRSGALAVIYAVAVSIFGGSTQFAIKWLTDLTGSSLVPAWYITGAVVIGAIAMTLAQETAPIRAGPS
jgi:MFS family permease